MSRSERRSRARIAGGAAAVATALALAIAFAPVACTRGGSGGGAGGSTSSSSGTPTVPPGAAGAAIALLVASPGSGAVADVPLDYALASPSGGSVDVDVEYSTDGGTAWFAATRGGAGEGTTGLASSVPPTATAHRFVWAAAEDLRATSQRRVKLRVTPRTPPGGAPSSATTTARFELDGSGVSAPVKLRRYPYVQNVVGDRATIVWITTAADQGSITWGNTTSLSSVATPAASGPATRHEVELTGLLAGAPVYYRVFSNGVPLGPGESFRAAPDQSQGFKFAVVGDSGNGSQNQYDVARQMEAFEPDMLIHMGDVIYDYGEASKYDPNFFAPYRDIARRAPFFMSLGNHDILTALGDPYLDAYVLPRNSRDNGERFYSFDYGNARFIALDTSIGFIMPGGAQHLWLIDELQRPRPDWLFVYFHHALYSTGEHGSNTVTRYLVSPLFEQAGVDVVFSGHDHHYERTTPRHDYAQVGNGTMYFVSGGGGAGLRGVAGNSGWSARSESAFHFLGCEISGRTMRIDAIRADGSTIETVTLTK